MVALNILQKISDVEWEIPVSYRKDMRVPVRLFASRRILEEAQADKSLEQAVNVATLPGLVGQVMVMPDVHQGYGFPIGGVAAAAFPDGVISPGGIGYDINCGVRLLASAIPLEAAAVHLERLAKALDHYCPSGVGVESELRLSSSELDEVFRDGATWALRRGMAAEQDIRMTEEHGALQGADPAQVSPKARGRGFRQLGTLGSGNHFIEVGVVEEILELNAAQTMGLRPGCLTLMVHCGSRGLGHQVCTDYVSDFQKAVSRYGIQIPDRELVCAPLSSPEGKAYLGAMRAAANFAFANRQVLVHQARKAFEEVFAGVVRDWQFHQVYDITHNIGKVETHVVDGKPVKVCVHRKGATRAFGPASPGVPEEYRKIGQPVLVPGSMGTASWVLVGTQQSMERSFGSACHGAGRVMSRSQAKRSVRGERLKEELSRQGIIIEAGSLSGLAEEAPQAYKDVDMVVDVVAAAGLARRVARLRPVVVVKG